MLLNILTPVMFQHEITNENLLAVLDNLNEGNGYKIRYNDKTEEFELSIAIYKFFFKIHDYGIAIFNLELKLADGKSYTYYLESRDKTVDWILKENRFVEALKSIDAIFGDKVKSNFFSTGKYVSYSLSTYFVNSDNLGYSLALKRKITNKKQLSDEQSLNVVLYPTSDKLLLTWGARVFISSSKNAFELFQRYLHEEKKAQMLWFLVTALNKRIDYYMLNESSDRSANIELLLDYSYGVLYRKSKFDSVKNSRMHRYEIEVSTSIINASKLNNLYTSLERKIVLLKEKSNIISNNRNKRNQKFINSLLVLISFLSAISTIYGFVSVFIEGGDKKILYAVISASVFVIFGLAYLIKNGIFKRKKRR